MAEKKKLHQLHQPRQSIKLDRVSPYDYQYLNMIYACEQCSHFDPENGLCTIGYNPRNHLKVINDQRFAHGGFMAFCRFQEID